MTAIDLPMPADTTAPGLSTNYQEPDPAQVGVVVPVLGAHPQAGSSGVALALADAAAGAGLQVLLIDSADPARSGLTSVCQLEGRSFPASPIRDSIRLGERRTGRTSTQVRRLVGTGSPQRLEMLPRPIDWMTASGPPVDLTVVDLGWDLWQLTAPRSRLGPLQWCCLRSAPTMAVLVMRPSRPSVMSAEVMLARYEIGIRAMGLHGVSALAAVGGTEWPMSVRAAMGPTLVSMADQAEFIPLDNAVLASGWTSAPAPAPSVRAAANLLRRLGGPIAEAIGPPPPVRRGLFHRS
jgi:hypothetical protein